MLDRFEFLVSEAFAALRRNGWMTFAAVTTVAVALFLMGGLGYVYLRLSDFAETLPGKLELRVHLKDGTTTEQIKETAKSIRAIDGVNVVVWLPKDAEWSKWKKEFPGALTEGESPFPDAFKVTLSDLDKTESVVSKVQQIDTVSGKGIRYDSQVQDAVRGWLGFIRWLGIGLGGLLFFTAGVLINNAIRLTIDSRRREIKIMQLVGASGSTIRVPFMIEGIIQGFIGGLLASVLLLSANAAVRGAAAGMTSVGGLPPFPFTKAMFILCSAGMAYGLICAMMALRAPMRSR